MDDYRHLYSTGRWRWTRDLVLLRAGYRCQMTPGCPTRATTCDHVVPAYVLAQTGELDRFFDPTNLRAACARCNYAAGARLVNALNRRRGRRRRAQADDAWAARENAYWSAREVEAGREPPPLPAVY